jgi:hypothetical protein
LGTLALGTFTNVSNQAIQGSDPVLEVIASADDADYIYDETNTTHESTGWVTVATTLPADLASVATLSIRLRYAWQAGTQVNTWNSISAQVLKSDGTTPLTDKVAVVSGGITTTTPTDSSVVAFTGVDTAATKAEWQAAQVRLFIDISKFKGGDTIRRCLFAGELTGTYTAGSTENAPAVTASFVVPAPTATPGAVTQGPAAVVASIVVPTATASSPSVGGGLITIRPFASKPPPGWRPDWLNPLNRDLVAWWPFNEGAGQVVHDIGPYGYHLTITNEVASVGWVAAEGGFAWRAEADANDDHLYLDKALCGHLNDLPLAPFSFALRMRGSFAQGRVLLSKTRNSTQGWSVGWNFTSAFNVVIQHVGTDISRQTANGYVTRLDNVGMHLVVGTYDASGLASGFRWFFDGDETTYGTSTGGDGSYVVEDGSSHLRIGGGGGTNATPSFYSDIRFWRRELTPEDVKALWLRPY